MRFLTDNLELAFLIQWSTGAAAKLLFIPTFNGNYKNLLVAVNKANDNVLYLQTIYVT